MSSSTSAAHQFLRDVDQQALFNMVTEGTYKMYTTEKCGLNVCDLHKGGVLVAGMLPESKHRASFAVVIGFAHIGTSGLCQPCRICPSAAPSPSLCSIVMVVSAIYLHGSPQFLSTLL